MNALSIFSGCGGFDIGVSQAGYNILASIELDHHACDTLREHFTHKVIEQDIRTVEPLALMEDLNLQSGQLDLLFGGPPCQAFSTAGKRKALEDERGMLLFQVVRFAHVFRPRTILIEQVKGLLSAPDREGEEGGVFNLLLSDLKALGYDVKWKIINTANYGVAQLRERVFIVGILGKNTFKFPNPTHAPKPGYQELFPMPYHKTIGEVLANIDTTDVCHVDRTPERDRRRIHSVPEGGYLAMLPDERGGLTDKDTTKFRRLARNAPALTLRCGEIFFHPTEDRYLTPREYLRIHGYPDGFKLIAPIRGRSGQAKTLDQHRLVANSVPPPIAYILARQLQEQK